jgi:enediyne biosynthesis protein E4
VLLGKSNGAFEVIPSRKSGFNVTGDAKGLARLSSAGGDLYIATQNLDSLKIFEPTRQDRVHFTPKAGDAWAELKMAGGRTQKIEFYYGSGYYSQSSRTIALPSGIVEMIIHTFGGEVRNEKIIVN